MKGYSNANSCRNGLKDLTTNKTDHDREEDGDHFDGLDNPEQGEACQLNEGEQVNSLQRNFSQERIVRLK